MEGINTTYHGNGKVKSQFIIHNGKTHGLYREYNNKGDLISETNYKDGELCGKKYRFGHKIGRAHV